jgi:hypothetical protein
MKVTRLLRSFKHEYVDSAQEDTAASSPWPSSLQSVLTSRDSDHHRLRLQQ